jgi:hypothetical protein
MTLREALLNAIGESCAVAPPTATQQRNFSADPTLSALLDAAMRAAAHWKDDPEEWRRQCMEVPPHQRGDLLDHLQRQYPKP